MSKETRQERIVAPFRKTIEEIVLSNPAIKEGDVRHSKRVIELNELPAMTIEAKSIENIDKIVAMLLEDIYTLEPDANIELVKMMINKLLTIDFGLRCKFNLFIQE